MWKQKCQAFVTSIKDIKTETELDLGLQNVFTGWQVDCLKWDSGSEEWSRYFNSLTASQKKSPPDLNSLNSPLSKYHQWDDETMGHDPPKKTQEIHSTVAVMVIHLQTTIYILY